MKRTFLTTVWLVIQNCPCFCLFFYREPHPNFVFQKIVHDDDDHVPLTYHCVCRYPLLQFSPFTNSNSSVFLGKIIAASVFV